MDSQVLIIGAGPVGLTMAIELGRRGLEVVLVDKRPGFGKLPKMERCNARTMESFRRMGIADEIRAAGLDNDMPMDVFICLENLVNPPLVCHAYDSVTTLRSTYHATTDGTTPAEPYQLISQYTLEPLLRTVAERYPGVRVEFGHELVDIAQDGKGVTAQLRTSDGTTVEARADYLVGCDGASSMVREHLSFVLEGESLLQMRQALFYSEDLLDRIPIGVGRHYHIADDSNSFLIVQDDKKHFSLHATVSSDEEMAPLFERIVGFPIAYEQLYVGGWQQRLMLADHYRDRRVFLAGDSAHLVIPTGGLGMNTGHGDAVDLSWKLAAVLHGWGGPALLDSYEAERRPVGARNVAASRRAALGRRAWRDQWRPEIAEDSAAGEAARAQLVEVAEREQRWSNDLYGIELGYRYTGSPVLVDGAATGDAEAEIETGFAYHPVTEVGYRLPNTWMADGRAIQDVVGDEYALVCSELPSSTDALEKEFARVGAPLRIVRLDTPEAVAVYGDGPVLVRPDLHVVWRGPDLPTEVGQLVDTVTGHRTAGGMSVATTPTASPVDLEPQELISAEIRDVQAATRPGADQPRLDFAPYRSSVLRHPTKDLHHTDPETIERVVPCFGHWDVDPLEADLTIGHAGEPLGERIVVTGRIVDGDGRPVRRQLVEIWQANAGGRYVHKADQHPAPLDPNFTGAGRALTDEDGWYRFTTIKPGPYPWRNHRNAWRPSHIHFSLFGSAFTQRLVTQMYFPGDPLIPLDPICQAITDQKARERLVASYAHDVTSHEWATGYRWDVVLTGRASTPLEQEDHR